MNNKSDISTTEIVSGGAGGSTYYGTVSSVTGPLTGNGLYNFTNTHPNYHANIHIAGTNPILSTDKGAIDLNELAEMMKIMRERLLILVPNFEKHEKYEALKKAYDQYKLIEAMVMEENDGK